MRQQFYQVVILAGGSGQLLYPLCEKYPKCLLPIANKPLIAYQLELLEEHGFHEVLIVTTKHHQKIENYIHHYQGRIRAEVFNVHQDDLDSAEVLVLIQDRIIHDFILMSCDIISDVNLFDFIDFHNSCQSTLSVLLKKEDLESGKKLGKAPVSFNLSDSYDIYFMSHGTNAILHVIDYDEVESNKGSFSVKRSLLLQYPKIDILTNLFDSHLYICKKAVIELIKEVRQKNPEIKNFKEEFLPYLAQNMLNKELQQVYMQQVESRKNNGQLGKLFYNEQLDKESKIGIYGFICEKNYCRRSNNIKDFQQANFESLLTGERALKCYQITQNNEEIQVFEPVQGKKIQISPDSIIGEDTKIEDKVTIQRSVIGKNCILKDNVKIINSIIMKETTINSGCVIQNSILSNNTFVQSNCVLERCVTGPQAVIEPNSKKQDETFVKYEN